MRSPEFGHPEREDFDPKKGLPPTERLTPCTICFQPNCADPTHKLERVEETETMSAFETLLEREGEYAWTDTEKQLVITEGKQETWEYKKPIIFRYTDREWKHGEVITNKGIQTRNGPDLEWPTLGPDGSIAAWDHERNSIVIFQSDGSIKELETEVHGTQQIRIPEYTKQNELLLNGHGWRFGSITGQPGPPYKFASDGSIEELHTPTSTNEKTASEGKIRMADNGSCVLSQIAHGREIRIIAPDNTVRILEDRSLDVEREYTHATLLPNGDVVAIAYETNREQGEKTDAQLVRIKPNGKVLRGEGWVGRDINYTSLAVFPNGSIMLITDNIDIPTRVYDPDGKRYRVNSPDDSKITFGSVSPKGDVLLMSGQEKMYVFSKQQKESAEEEAAKNQPPIARKF